MNPLEHAALPPAFDARALDAYTGGDPGIAREIYFDFIRLGRTDLDAARAALAGRDGGALARAAHRIKGSGRMIGALPAAEAADRVERAARDGDWEGATAEMPALEDRLRDLFPLLEAACAVPA